jgi:hypothetical protein
LDHVYRAVVWQCFDQIHYVTCIVMHYNQ